MFIVPVANIKIVRGDDKTIGLTFSKSGVPIDITGWTIYFTIKHMVDQDLTDTSAVLKKDIISHSDPTNGKSQITLTHDETKTFEGNYAYDIQTKDTLGKITTVVGGQILVDLDITRRMT